MVVVMLLPLRVTETLLLRMELPMAVLVISTWTSERALWKRTLSSTYEQVRCNTAWNWTLEQAWLKYGVELEFGLIARIRE
jgi:hypothetical protein